ncbi:enoyl-CoA hydratase/isomerase family protein [Lacisediminimonas sp.]|uniref:enoyl-CoA hydratase/isomerase family protein n=1 Tax=Lacisediminimonas sp. TaxID=3060582 RepID=UPI00271FBF8D|nr:enoyl-CoA hydratase/isomerase family protein [Lacisediminimonas sp.]MDO8300243.1 enoyl-CoA hydratase/isomerase family protein [Lacisediminimonas sp.]
MSNGQVHLSIHNGVAQILIDRPQARNAMTWSMYEELGRICEQLRDQPEIRVATIRGAGGEAFVAGTDIEQFRTFEGGEDGIAYEKVIDQRIGQIEALPMPTVAIVDGWAIGGGLAISAACDFRIATPKSAFGLPIARTLGNCLSSNNVARVVAAFGVARAKRMLLLAETIPAEEAKACGFVTVIAPADELDQQAAAMCARLAQHAPVTMRVSKEAIRRVIAQTVPEGDDLVRACYGSRDFMIGVNAFLDKKRPEWTGS